MSDISFYVILFTPLLSFVLTSFGESMSFKYRHMLQKILYLSLVFICFAWYALEKSIPNSTDIRVDLFLIIPCIIVQFFIVFNNRIQIRDDKIVDYMRVLELEKMHLKNNND